MFLFDPQTPAETALPDPSRERTERHLRVMQELAEIGMDLARLVRGQVQAAAPETSASDLGLSFARIARAARQTVALEARLDEDEHARQQRRAAERRAEAARLVAETRRRGGSRKLQAVQIVERAYGLESDYEDEENSDAEALNTNSVNGCSTAATTPTSPTGRSRKSSPGSAATWGSMWVG